MKQRVILSRSRPINNLSKEISIFGPYWNCFGPEFTWRSLSPTKAGSAQIKVQAQPESHPRRTWSEGFSCRLPKPSSHPPTRVASMPSKPRAERREPASHPPKSTAPRDPRSVDSSISLPLLRLAAGVSASIPSLDFTRRIRRPRLSY
jgi:hypothetical protein